MDISYTPENDLEPLVFPTQLTRFWHLLQMGLFMAWLTFYNIPATRHCATYTAEYNIEIYLTLRPRSWWGRCGLSHKGHTKNPEFPVSPPRTLESTKTWAVQGGKWELQSPVCMRTCTSKVRRPWFHVNVTQYFSTAWHPRLTNGRHCLIAFAFPTTQRVTDDVAINRHRLMDTLTAGGRRAQTCMQNERMALHDK